MRAFVAIDLEDGCRAKASKIIESFSEAGGDVKFVEPQNLHITLKFLGDVSEDDVKRIESSLLNGVKMMKPFKISLKGVGYFGSPKNIRTIWIGIENGRDGLISLSNMVNECLKDIFSMEGASPHLTIGRVRSAKNREAIMDEINSMKDVKIGEMAVSEIKLKSSTLTKTGPVYEDVCVFRIGERGNL
jgi:2'-5' RNA ligase